MHQALRIVLKQADSLTKAWRNEMRSLPGLFPDEDATNALRLLVNLLDTLCLIRFVSDEMEAILEETKGCLDPCFSFLAMLGDSGQWRNPEYVQVLHNHAPSLRCRLVLMIRLLHLCQVSYVCLLLILSNVLFPALAELATGFGAGGAPEGSGGGG